MGVSGGPLVPRVKQRMPVQKGLLTLPVPEDHQGPLERLRHPVYPFWYALGQSSQDAILALGSQMDPAQDGELGGVGGADESFSVFLRMSQVLTSRSPPSELVFFSNSLGQNWLCLVLCVWATVCCYDAE